MDLLGLSICLKPLKCGLEAEAIEISVEMLVCWCRSFCFCFPYFPRSSLGTTKTPLDNVRPLRTFSHPCRNTK